MHRSAMGVVMICATCGVAHGMLLQNGDLELPGGNDVATGWTLVEPDMTTMGDPVDSASFQSFGNHTPAGSRGLWFRAFEGGFDAESPATVNATLYQDVAGVAGAKYVLSAWFKYESNYSGLDAAAPTMTLLSLEFLDAGDGVIGSSVLDVDTVAIGDSTWRQYMVMGVAPAGTVGVRASAAMVDGVIEPANPQSAFVDDFELVPGPGPAVALGLWSVVGLRRRR